LNSGAIWTSPKDVDGLYIQLQEEISKAIVAHFQLVYGHNEGIVVEDLIWGVDPYPSMYDEDSNATLYQKVTEEELHEVLKSFKGDKSQGPDGWTMKLFTHFFDLFKK